MQNINTESSIVRFFAFLQSRTRFFMTTIQHYIFDCPGFRFLVKNMSSMYSVQDYGIAPAEYQRKALWGGEGASAPASGDEEWWREVLPKVPLSFMLECLLMTLTPSQY